MGKKSGGTAEKFVHYIIFTAKGQIESIEACVLLANQSEK